MEIKRKSPLSRPSPSSITSFKRSYPIKSSDLAFLNSMTQIKSKVSLVSNKITKNWLPPLNLSNYSKDLNSSVASLELEDTGIERKTEARTEGKKEKLFKSSSVKLLKSTAENSEESEKKRENKKMRTNSLQMSAVETPTFRNLNCGNDEERKKGRAEDWDVGVKVKARNSLMQITSHFVGISGEANKNLRNCGLGRGSRTVNRIKVLHHKFPRDMFFHK